MEAAEICVVADGGIPKVIYLCIMLRLQWKKLILSVMGALLVLEACSTGRTGKRSSFWQRKSGCPSTRVGNHAYYYY